MLVKLRTKFSENGSFDLPTKENVTKYIRLNKVPNRPGICFIFAGHGCKGDPIYIGKAGTLTQAGLFRPQGIAKRLGAKQNGKTRNCYFQQIMRQKYKQGLSFAWFVTYGNGHSTLPALAEAEEIQKFLQKNRCLPALNKAF
ncbi:hypothetical protein [Microbulbifer sp. ANSA005]|uniref:hypothetical protein n=1 Tax=Microbulbifer sp. ANSA005 TaxID=3243362 RepID=UPI004042C4B5